MPARLPRAIACFVFFMAFAVDAFAAGAVIIDDFLSVLQFGPRTFTSTQNGGMGTPPTFCQAASCIPPNPGWGVVTLKPVNSIVTATLTYTAAAPFDLTGGGFNDQFLMEFVAVIADNPTGFTQVSNLQITIHTQGGAIKQYSGIGVGEGQVNQALPFANFTGGGNLTKVTSIDLSFNSVSNQSGKGGQIIIDRVWVSPLAGAVPTAPGGNFTAITASPSGASSVVWNLKFTNNQGDAPVQGLTTSDFTVSSTAGAVTAAVPNTIGASYDVTISGMTQDGTISISLPANTITDLWQQSGPGSLISSSTITWIKPPTFTNGPPPNTVVYGTAYGPFTYTATGNAGYPITYALAPGANLPTGLNLASNGTLSGTPTALGTFTGSTRATNVGFTDQAYSITVTCPPITVSPGSISDPVEFSPYSQAFTASGVPGTYAFSISAGALPQGMSLSGSGVLTGPATQKTAATFTVQALGPAGFSCVGTQSYTINVQPPVITVSPASLPGGSRGAAYSQTITASGSPNGFTFAVTSGALPPGLTLAGTGALTGTPSAVGSYNFTVTASDPEVNTGSQSYTVAVAPTTTTTTLASSANPSVSGQNVTFTATVTGVLGPPIGNVTFMDGATPLGTVALNGAGVATLAVANLTVASHSIQASYAGTADFLGSSSNTISQVVNKTSTSNALVASVNPSVSGQSVTFTATVTAAPPGTGTPPGSVTFMDGATPIGTTPLDGAGVASLSVSNLTVGAHSIQATYAATTNFQGSASNTVAQVVDKIATSTNLVVSPNPAVTNQTLTLTATVSSIAPGSGTPAGSVTFTDGVVSLSTVALDGAGIATLSLPGYALGAHMFQAQYAGSATYAASTSASVPHTTNKGDSITALFSSSNPAAISQSVTFTATVTAAPPAAGVPTGSVSFADGATPLATVPLAAGTAAFSTSALAIGSHSITVSYSGDAGFNASASAPLSQAISSAIVIAPVSLPNPVRGTAYSQTITASGIPAGPYTFTVSAGTLPPGLTLATSGLLSGTPTTPGAFSFTVEAANGPGPASQAYSVTVAPSATTTALAVAPNPSTLDQSVTLTATVSGPLGPPTGSVTFKDGGASLGAVSLDAGGNASLTTAGLALGAHTLQASYSGDANFSASDSNIVNQTVNKKSALTALSARGQIGTGFDVMIGGFVIDGATNKTVVISGLGPSLIPYGISTALDDPTLLLLRDQVIIASNDNWGDAANAAAIASSGFAPSDPREAAILTTLAPGPYTVIIAGSGGRTGIGLVDIFEVDHPEVPIVNMSTRGKVGDGFNVMIGGFVIPGPDTQTLVVRAIGPSLANYGVDGALQNPMLTLVRMSDNTVVASNDNWGDSANAAQIQTKGFAPSDSLESAILITLPPGAYTAIVTGNGGAGVALVEVYGVN